MGRIQPVTTGGGAKELSQCDHLSQAHGRRTSALHSAIGLGGSRFREQAPHKNTLLRWIHDGRNQPQPKKIGRT